MSAADQHLSAAAELIRQAEAELIRASSVAGIYDDALVDLGNLATLVRWQCEAPDLPAIRRACGHLRAARMRRERMAS